MAPLARFIFVHIPKTGGQSISAVIWRQYLEQAIFQVYSADERDAIDRFNALPQQGRDAIRAVTGHMHYGLQDHLGPYRWRCITLLREPVARIVSHYHYAKRTPQSPLHQQIVEEGLDLEGYVTRSEYAGIFNNGQVRLLGNEVFAEESADRASLERAKRNLQACAAVGITERFASSVILMKRALGWRMPLFPVRNVAPTDPAPISSRERAVIEARNDLDIELYEFARDLHKAQVAEHGLSLRSESAAFDALNRLYQSERGREFFNRRYPRPRADY